jgi:uncharacterized protein (TIGR02996 family)
VTDEPFLRAILDAPDDDGPRLVYADWLDERGDHARAEFIRLQVEMERLGEEHPARGLMEQREYTLLAAHHREWVAPLPKPRGIQWDRFARLSWPKIRTLPAFERGFACDIIAENGTKFCRHASRVFRASPVTGLRFNCTPLNLSEVLAQPEVDRLRHLDLGAHKIGEVGALALANARLMRLTSLDLIWNDLGPAGVNPLFGAPWLGRLTDLVLTSNNLGPTGAEALSSSAALATLDRLHIGANDITDAGADALLASTHLSRLSNLSLSGNGISRRFLERWAGTVRFGQFRCVELSVNPMGDAGAEAIRSIPTPSRLRELYLG